MKKKILIGIEILLVLLFLELGYTYLKNEQIKKSYQQGTYQTASAKSLTYLNIAQTYIAPYNYGNHLYQEGDYAGAIEQYQKALQGLPPKEKECQIRINLALAMIKLLNFEDKSETNIKTLIQVLNEAKDILCEKGCAHEKDQDGHNKDAQQLKEEIDAMLKALEDPSSSSEQGEEEERTEEERQQEEEKKQRQSAQKKKEEQLREIQRQSAQSRSDDLQLSSQMSEYSYYSGRSW